MHQQDSDNGDAASKPPRIVKFFPEKGTTKQMRAIPEKWRDRFLTNLTLVSKNMEPACAVSPLQALGPDVYELKENGRPAWRCVYYTGIKGVIYVLYVAEKTTNGIDRQLMSTVAERLKALIAAIKAGTE